MIPIGLIKAAKLSEVTGPAIVLPSGKYGETFLVTGGKEPLACCLSGAHKNHAFLASASENWHGAAIQGVSLEVCPDSIYSVSENDLALGSVVLGSEGAFFVAKVKTQGWTDTLPISILRGSDIRDNGSIEKVGFVRWRAVLDVGNRREVVFDTEGSGGGVDATLQAT